MCVGEVVHVEEWPAGTKERCASFVQWTMDCYRIPLHVLFRSTRQRCETSFRSKPSGRSRIYLESPPLILSHVESRLSEYPLTWRPPSKVLLSDTAARPLINYLQLSVAIIIELIISFSLLLQSQAYFFCIHQVIVTHYIV